MWDTGEEELIPDTSFTLVTFPLGSVAVYKAASPWAVTSPCFGLAETARKTKLNPGAHFFFLSCVSPLLLYEGAAISVCCK